MLSKVYKKVQDYGLVPVIKYIIKIIFNKYRTKQLRKNIINGLIDTHITDNFVSNMNFFYTNTDRTNIKKFYQEYPKFKEQILFTAQNILNHKFDLLGSGITFLGKDINWHQDFKTGFTWENVFYQDIKIVDLNNNADVKVPWELSRFQHLFTLGKAFWITNDDKYYLESKSQILDWITKNPLYIGVNWTCAMDVAIRAINWIFFYFLFEDHIKEDKSFLSKFNHSLYQHGIYIYSNLEKGLSPTNNHYLSNLSGLLFLGIYFQNLGDKNSKKWLTFSIKELEKEMLIQNNADGTNYESSTAYHRLVTELMFFPMLLAEKNNLNFSTQYKNQLEKMFEFLAKITKKNGKFPLIGDVDNGRLVILSNYNNWDVNDARSTLSLGGEYYNNHLLQGVGAKELEDKLWIFNSIQKYPEKFYDKSVKFEQGGYYILRNENIYCMIRCGELSCRGQGGHSHNDQLSIELNINGEDFFIDPGTGVYTANKQIRNLFRSTKQHNTVAIDGLEQNDFDENNLFSMPEQSFAKCTQFTNTKFSGIHRGFIHSKKCIHNRKIRLLPRSLEISDYLDNENGIINFILDKNINILEKNNQLILENKKSILKVSKKGYKVKSTMISEEYGKYLETKKLEFYFHNETTLQFEIDGENRCLI